MSVTEEFVRPTSASDWKANSDTVIVDVPSGNKCRARQNGLQAFLKAGIIPNSLVPVVTKAMQSGMPPDLSQLEKDPQKVNDAVILMDRVVVEIMVEPRVLPVPPQEDTTSEFYNPDFERDEESLYVDQVDLMDKVFLFQWACGGTSDLETFRREADESMGRTRPRQNVRQPAKRTAGAKKR